MSEICLYSFEWVVWIVTKFTSERNDAKSTSTLVFTSTGSNAGFDFCCQVLEQGSFNEGRELFWLEVVFGPERLEDLGQVLVHSLPHRILGKALTNCVLLYNSFEGLHTRASEMNGRTQKGASEKNTWGV